VSEAVAQNVWEEVGTLNETPTTAKRPPAIYSVTEKKVTLYEKEYRAIVVHSSAHDKRRLKRLERQLKKSITTLSNIIAQETKLEFFCRPDAAAAASRLKQYDTELHNIAVHVEEKVSYTRGRPPKNGKRKVLHTRYVLNAYIEEKNEQIKQIQAESGCFVLLTNVPQERVMAETGGELLKVYKEQYGIEKNFSFLKDPLIVNDIFLKKPERIEVLGAVLLISLMVWNLIEHTLRQYIKENEVTLPGWDKKQTTRPTAFMMSIQFMGIQVVRVAGVCRLATPLTDGQKRYLKALNLSEADLLGEIAGGKNLKRQ